MLRRRLSVSWLAACTDNVLQVSPPAYNLLSLPAKEFFVPEPGSSVILVCYSVHLLFCSSKKHICL
jgi:hypothetical protein